MDQNFIINFANEIINNLYSDISNTNTNENITTQVNDVSATLPIPYIFRPYTYRPYTYRPYTFRPYTIRPYTIRPNTFRPNTFTPYTFTPNTFRPININYIDTHTNTYDSSYITPDTINPNPNPYNDLNYPRAVTLRDLLRTLYINYYEEDNNNTSLESFINNTFENKTKFKKVIADSELEKLKPQKFNKINETETNILCPILCYNFEENEEIIKLPCNHNYNSEAIIKWLSQESNTCPVCRHEFDYKEIDIDNKRPIIDTNIDTNIDTTEETANIYNLFSNEEILMQQILLDNYSNNIH